MSISIFNGRLVNTVISQGNVWYVVPLQTLLILCGKGFWSHACWKVLYIYIICNQNNHVAQPYSKNQDGMWEEHTRLWLLEKSVRMAHWFKQLYVFCFFLLKYIDIIQIIQSVDMNLKFLSRKIQCLACNEDTTSNVGGTQTFTFY